MSEIHRGQCVCGHVSYQVTGEPKRVTICHCAWCQRRTGSAFGVEAVFDADQIKMSDNSLACYRHHSDESGRWLDQLFCGKCGCNIGFTLEAVPGIQTIAAGTFDDPSWLHAEKYQRTHVFTRSAQDWAVIPDHVECFEKYFR